jgi:hypothetical protein
VQEAFPTASIRETCAVYTKCLDLDREQRMQIIDALDSSLADKELVTSFVQSLTDVGALRTVVDLSSISGHLLSFLKGFFIYYYVFWFICFQVPKRQIVSIN